MFGSASWRSSQGTLFYNFGSQLLLTVFSQFLFTTLVPNFCSQFLFGTFFHNFCSKLMFTTLVHNFCSAPLFITFCSQFLFTTFVHNSCSQLMLSTHVHNSCSQENGYKCFLVSFEVGSRGYIFKSTKSSIFNLFTAIKISANPKHCIKNMSKISLLASYTIFHVYTQPTWWDPPFLTT